MEKSASDNFRTYNTIVAIVIVIIVMGCSQTAVIIHLLRCQMYLFAGLPPLAFYHLVFIHSFSNDVWGPCLVLGMALGAVGPTVNETDTYLPALINVHPSGAADYKQTKNVHIILDGGQCSGKNKARWWTRERWGETPRQTTWSRKTSARGK